jgi:hypothetical protein
MAYLLVRSVIVLIGWGMTCGLIMNVWSNVDPVIFYVAGASWAFAGIAYVGYLRKLRREAHDQRIRLRAQVAARPAPSADREPLSRLAA